MKILNRIALLLIISLLYNCKNEGAHDGYVINGTTSDTSGLATLVITDLITKTDKVIDSAKVIDGKFQFKGKIDFSDQVIITLDKDRSHPFFIDNTNIFVDLNPSEFPNILEAKVMGSKLQDDLEVFENQVKAIQNDEKYKELRELNKTYNEAGRNRDVKLQEELYKKFDDYKELSLERANRIQDLQMDYLKNNPSSPITPEIVEFLFNDRATFEELTSLLNAFKGAAKQTQNFKYFSHKYEIRKRTALGQPAPDFTLKDTEGNDVSLSGLKGKYVLLDFWASWCKPCRASYPHLKEVYKKYKNNGFEVLAISTDRKPEQWLKAIEEDQTVWLQVIDRFVKRGPSEISDLYSVPFLPTTYLVDDKGTILAKNLHANALDKKLETVFGF
ncbi:TlpA disulfide reductase family protein [Flavivirga spongiicola]|uniref:AhpC/TSA family protein n=1 Tax=Flavivirga spongiicola TaxID=421621 RepID=A0ABU7XW93_9FLAO|nr:TlpA disulfide reductase family protein [Flavivirga sp. MEBiC05379]MDO5979685.1 TlpA disulfide reductase family protein [Flavivirga sp. MEBiC05379]